MSRFVLGDSVQVMAGYPASSVDFVLTEPPYLVGFKDRSGRSIAGDVNDEWVQPAFAEMFRVLKPNSLAVSFYDWNRVDTFMTAWKRAGFRVVAGSVHIRSLIPISSDHRFRSRPIADSDFIRSPIPVARSLIPISSDH